MKKIPAYKTFSLVALGCLIFLGAIGYTNQDNHVKKAEAASAPSQSVSKATGTPEAEAARETRQYKNYLTITEWGMQVGVDPVIADATYHGDGTTVWLSTAGLDLDASCYDQNAPSQTFASITRHRPDDIVTIGTTPTDPGTSMSAMDAIAADKFEFRNINGFVYQYKLDDDNEPCAAETHAQVNAFTDAWLSLRPL